VISASTSSTACRDRSFRPRWLASTSTAADIVINGDRSSWLTSDAKRASRSMRSCRACAMSLNDMASGPRSGSAVPPRRVSSRPPAMACAAWLTSLSGVSTRRLAHHPRPPPANVVSADAPSSEKARARSVSSMSSSGKISKYAAFPSGNGTPMLSCGVPSRS
jgi:hypothetical protein